MAADCTGALITALNDPSDEVRSDAATGLANAGKAGPPPGVLLAALDRDSSARVRAAAAQSLGEFRSGHDQSTVALFHALGKDEPEVRKACDSALDRLKVRRDTQEPRRSAAIVPALIVALKSHDPLVRYHAAAVLGEIGADAQPSIPALVGMLSEAPFRTNQTRPHRRPRRSGEIAPAIPQAGEAVTALIAFFRATTSDLRRAQAAGALGRFPPELTAPALPVLLDVLKETVGRDGLPAPTVCVAIGRAAPGTPWEAKAVEALSAALDSRWGFTRSEAASALARIGRRARSALPRLRALENTDPEPAVRKVASLAAARIEGGDDQGTPE